LFLYFVLYLFFVFIFYYPALLSHVCVVFLNCISNVEELIRFPDVKAHSQLTYGAKQLIAREVKSPLHTHTHTNLSSAIFQVNLGYLVASWICDLLSSLLWMS